MFENNSKFGSHEVSSMDESSPHKGHLFLDGDLAWLQEALGTILRGSIFLLTGPAGGGKSTLALETAVGLAQNGLSVLVILTEQSRTAAEYRLAQIVSMLPEQARREIWRRITFEDRLSDVGTLPEFFMGVISKGAVAGGIPDLIIIDSLQGNSLHSNSKAYQRVFALFALCRNAGVTCLAISHQTKSGHACGPSALGHAVDVVAVLHAASRHRYLSILKNRNGPALNDPIPLLMTMDSARLVPDPHAKPMASSVWSLLPGDSTPLEVQLSIGIPGYGNTGRLICPGLPKAEVNQLLDSVGRLPEMGTSLSGFVVNIQIPGERFYRKTLHLPMAVAAAASLLQSSISQKVYFIGELDLNLDLHPLPRPQLSALVSSLRIGFISGMTLICSDQDSSSLAVAGDAVTVEGYSNFREILERVQRGYWATPL